MRTVLNNKTKQRLWVISDHVNEILILVFRNILVLFMKYQVFLHTVKMIQVWGGLIRIQTESSVRLCAYFNRVSASFSDGSRLEEDILKDGKGVLNICVMSLCSTTETIRYYRAAVRRSGQELNKGSKNGGRLDSERRPPVKDVVLNMHANVKDAWRCLKWTYFFQYIEEE